MSNNNTINPTINNSCRHNNYICSNSSIIRKNTKKKYQIRAIFKSIIFILLVLCYVVCNTVTTSSLHKSAIVERTSQQQKQIQQQSQQQQQQRNRRLQAVIDHSREDEDDSEEYQKESHRFQGKTQTIAIAIVESSKENHQRDKIITKERNLVESNKNNSSSSSSETTITKEQEQEQRQQEKEECIDSKDIDVAEPSWYIIFYLLGVLYMFLAIAIVCDELFVPTLEEISSSRQLNLSMDVAGATLMAAGGSAPELFTSIFGTFLTEDEIGIGTVVGSAVFNVLFVIAMCALLVKDDLKLTWWPLFRDSSYYTLGLIMLGLFVGVISEGIIELWEAIVLFIMYIIYVIIMIYNTRIYKALTGKELQDLLPDDNNNTEEDTYDDENGSNNNGGSSSSIRDDENEIERISITNNNNDNNGDNGNGDNSGSDQVQRAISSLASNTIINDDGSDQDHPTTTNGNRRPRLADITPYPSCDDDADDSNSRWPGTFRTGILKLLRDPNSWVDTVGIGLVGHIHGDVHHVFLKVDLDGNGVIDQNELEQLFLKLDCNASHEEVINVFQEIDTNSDGKISEEEFTVWYIRSKELILSKVRLIFDRFDTNHSGTIDREKVKTLLEDVEPTLTDEDIDKAFFAMYGNGSHDEITFEEFSNWYVDSMVYDRQRKRVEEDIEGICASLKPPWGGGFVDYAKYIFILPIVSVLAFTVPDVRRPGWHRWCYVSFILSIVWIGFFSFFMVAWAEIIGNTIGIPSVVMGLTLVAAGTSVPDLLSSVIVARMGEGDMALSSSIGSNIFDINVGLPLPWIIYTALPSKPDVIVIGSENVWISIFTLLGMLVFIIAIIHCQKWKLTKMLGVLMFLLYFAFLAQSILLELPFETC